MEVLNKLRELAGLTLRQVEEATGISNAYLSQLENGKIKKPSAQILYKLSKLYSVDFERLLIDAGFVVGVDITPAKMSIDLSKRMDELEARIKKLESSNWINEPLH